MAEPAGGPKVLPKGDLQAGLRVHVTCRERRRRVGTWRTDRSTALFPKSVEADLQVGLHAHDEF
jgi:hypothetical protein